MGGPLLGRSGWPGPGGPGRPRAAPRGRAGRRGGRARRGPLRGRAGWRGPGGPVRPRAAPGCRLRGGAATPRGFSTGRARDTPVAWSSVLGLPDSIRACLFDMDGVLTRTATVHMAAWKRTFDEFLRATDPQAAEFSQLDYNRFVDGKPRADGVRDLLTSRGITLPERTPHH